MVTVENYILLFFIYSCLGWLMEVINVLITTKKLVNRGFLIGPYCPIYGYGAILMTLLLQNLTAYPILLFILGLVICSLLEYLTSFFMEKLFHARWWDYSNKKFNINGRICLSNMIAFGILGCIVIYIFNPFFFDKMQYIPNMVLNILCIVFPIIYIVDNICSINIIKNIEIAKEIIKDNTEEIRKKVRDSKQVLANKLVENKAALTNKVHENKEKFTNTVAQNKQALSKKVHDDKEAITKLVKDNTEDLTRRVKEILLKRSIFTRRIVHAFPSMKIIKSKIKINKKEKNNKQTDEKR